jgi:hypothetical protein
MEHGTNQSDQHILLADVSLAGPALLSSPSESSGGGRIASLRVNLLDCL